MFASYVKTAVRPLLARPGLAAVQIAGLAIGLACCLLVGLYLRAEQLTDAHIPHLDRTYRVLLTLSVDGGDDTQAMTSSLLAPTLEASLPGVEATARLRSDDAVVEIAGVPHVEPFLYADPSVFDVLSLPLAAGRAGALSEPGEVVLSTEAARRFFGHGDAIGRVLPIRIREETHTLTVAGVMAPIPTTASHRPDVLVPFALYNAGREPSWRSLSPSTYVRLAEGTGRDDVATRLPAVVEAAVASSGASVVLDYTLQPLRDVRWTPEVGGTLARTSNPTFPLVLGVIALFVLGVACLNFTALALASGARRAREVGVRKSLGAAQRQLAAQFVGESVLAAALATGVGLALAAATLPTFRGLVGLDLRLASDPVLVGGLLALPIAVGLLAGAYPATVLARFRPSAVLRGAAGLGRPGTLVRGLAAVQFTTSAALVLATLLMGQQLRHVQNRPLGLDGGRLVRLEANYGSTYEGARILRALRTRLADDPAVESLAGTSTRLFGEPPLHVQSVPAGRDTVQSAVIGVTPEYAATLGLDVVAGRDLEVGQAADSLGAVLVNEAFARAVGPDVVGRRSSMMFRYEDAAIVGVVSDFHLAPLYQSIRPAVFYVGVNPAVWDVYARTAPGRGREAVEALRRVWTEVAPGVPFQASFVSQDARAPYAADERTARLVLLASLFAIGTACLGLFALARLEGVRRTREVGVRKVLGASTARVAALLTREFAVVIGPAFVVAVPLTVLGVRRWLDTFAYRIDVGAGAVLLAGVLTLGVALAAVGASTVRAALADPVRSLRTE